MRTWQPNGVIAVLGTAQLDRAFLTLAAPVVSIGSEAIRGDWPQVTLDQTAVGRAAADHLLQKGHRRFIILLNHDIPLQKHRAEGFQLQLREHSFSEGSQSVQSALMSLASETQSALSDLATQLRAIPKPLGIFAASDQIGFLLCELCREHNIRIPEDIAIVAAGDHGEMAELARPPLTVVKHSWRKLGFEAAQVLHELMQSKSVVPRSVVVITPAEVIARNSTDFFAIADPDIAIALAFIRQNLHKSISVGHVAKRASLSRRVLELRFQQHLGRTPMQFIRALRLDRARKLLVDKKEPIGRIARECGFSNTTHFGVAFRRAYGISPSDFRDQQQRSSSRIAAKKSSSELLATLPTEPQVPNSEATGTV